MDAGINQFELFDLPNNKEPLDPTDIHQVCLYFSTEEKGELIEGVKELISRGVSDNINDLYLELVRAAVKRNGNT